MTPTILTKDGKLWLVTGTPGGSRIITMVLQQVLNMIDFEMNVVEATAVPRMHYQGIHIQDDVLFGASDYRKPGGGSTRKLNAKN